MRRSLQMLSLALVLSGGDVLHAVEPAHQVAFSFSKLTDRMAIGPDMETFDARTRGISGEFTLCEKWGLGFERVTGDATKILPMGKIDLRHEHTDLSVHYRITPQFRLVVGARSYHHGSYLNGVRLLKYTVNKGLYGLAMQLPLCDGWEAHATHLSNDVEMDFKVGLARNLGKGTFAALAFKSNRFQDSFMGVGLLRTQGLEGTVGLRF